MLIALPFDHRIAFMDYTNNDPTLSSPHVIFYPVRIRYSPISYAEKARERIYKVLKPIRDMEIPELKINKEGKLTDINGKKRKFKIGKYVTLPQSDYPKKIFILQEILFTGEWKGKKEIRIGYYIIGKKGKMKGKWTWGQFCPFFPKQDLEKIIEMAKRKGIL